MLPAGAAAAAVHPVQQSVIALLEKVVSLRLLFYVFAGAVQNLFSSAALCESAGKGDEQLVYSG